jgi:para-nitrobenzyl esterase
MFKLFGRKLCSRLRKGTDSPALKSALALALTLSAAALLAPIQAQAAGGPIVQTGEGLVQGFVTNGVAEFLGIPYGAPPVSTNPTAPPCSPSNLRWCPPVPHAPWTGVLEATAYGPICAQTNEFGLFAGPANDNEDCLYLNVFAPSVGIPLVKLPVIVWIHGGGNVDGETPGYDGSKLALQGHTVVVSMGYRLNAMGWLAHPALDAEGHQFGNYGLLDQQLALKWVRSNIARFGGDKNNVTLGGQSSGAINTGLNMVSPQAAGLFDRAICQSLCPAPLTPGGFSTPLATAEARGIAFSVKAGCGSGTDETTAQCLRSLTATQVETFAGEGNFIGGQGIIDGQIVPSQPMTAFANGQFNHMPFMNGNTEDEENFFLAITEYDSNTNNALRTPVTAAQYTSFVNRSFATPPYPAGTAAAVLALYPVGAYTSPELAYDRVGTDSTICGQRILDQTLAPQVPVYVYEFDDQTAPFYFPQMPGFLSLAYHTADIQYLFPLWHGGPNGIELPLNRQQENLSDELVAAWTNFAWTGNPNGYGNFPWPRYTSSTTTPAWLRQNLPILSASTDKQYSALRNCNFWAPLAFYTLPTP